jgi:hypothetical protein
MLNSGYMTADEMKSVLGLKSKSGDNRTLNKYVLSGKLAIKSFSRKVKVYKEVDETQPKQNNVEDWIF